MITETEKTEQQVCDMLVKREVVCCVSSLVSHFASNNEALSGSDYSEDDLFPLLTQKDYEEPVTDHVRDMTLNDLAEYLIDNQVEFNGDTTVKDLFRLMLDHIRDNEGFEDFANDNRIEPHENEVLEHWAVSKWFMEKLAEKGEATGELFDFRIWGRTCSGQAIHLDGVIVDIARDMEILPGMANAW